MVQHAIIRCLHEAIVAAIGRTTATTATKARRNMSSSMNTNSYCTDVTHDVVNDITTGSALVSEDEDTGNSNPKNGRHW